MKLEQPWSKCCNRTPALNDGHDSAQVAAVTFPFVQWITNYKWAKVWSVVNAHIPATGLHFVLFSLVCQNRFEKWHNHVWRRRLVNDDAWRTMAVFCLNPGHSQDFCRCFVSDWAQRRHRLLGCRKWQSPSLGRTDGEHLQDRWSEKETRSPKGLI